MSDAAVRSTREWQRTLGDWAPVAHEPGEGLDDDPTPRGVVRAVLEAAVSGGCLDGVNSEPLRVLDIGAGYGCWSSEMRRLAHAQGWPVHITGVELNPEREEHLRKWCDDVRMRGWRNALACRDCDGAGQYYARSGYCQSDVDAFDCESCGGLGAGAWDLIIGNPPFLELLREAGEFPLDSDGNLDPGQTMVGVCLRHAPAVLFLHTQQAFLKSEMGRAVQRAYPPAASWQVPGSVAFRGDGKADSRCYEATLFLRGHDCPCSRYLLPELPPEDRRWTVPPGSEDPDTARALGLPMVGDPC